jgi:hypothetical protein
VLSDVEVRHDLEARGHAALDRLRRAGDVVEHTVDPEPDPQVIGRRFDVDVRSPLLQRLAQDEVDVLDDRGVVDDGVKVLKVREVATGRLGNLSRRSGLGGCLGRLFVGAVHPRDVLGDLPRAGDDGHDVAAEDGPQIVHGKHVRWVRHGDDRGVVAVPDGQQLMAPGHRLWDQLDRLGVDGELVEVDELEPDLFGHGLDEVFLGYKPELREDLAELATGGLRFAHGRTHLLGRYLPRLDEHLGKRRCGLTRIS